MSGIAKPLHLRLFLEGIEVPVVSAHITVSINAPASASIQVVPIDSALDLLPRTMIHLFVLEVPSQHDKKASLETDYKLLFAGELIAYQFQQTPRSRGLVLQCVDFSSYWDSAHAVAIEYGIGGNAFDNAAAVIGANISLFDDIVSHHAEKLASWLHLPPGPKTPGLETVSGLAGGIIKILEAMAGVPNYTKGVNDFFTVAELRCHILEQIVAEENDSTASKLLDTKVFDEWLQHGLQNMGQQVTFRDIMKLLFQYIYYEAVPNPSAMFVEASGSRTQRLNSQIIRPDCWFAPPPVCNVIFPEQYVSLTYERNYVGEVTRLHLFQYNVLVSGPPSNQMQRLLSTQIVAPNFLSFMKSLKGNEQGYRVLLPHEYHTGIVPRQEYLPNTAGLTTKEAGVGAITATGDRLSWMQKVALFHFFKYRFAPRMASVSGKLNYNMVCGFPAAVIRAPFIPNASAMASGAEEVLKAPASFGAPNQLIGMVAYYTHAIDQSGGTTTVQLHHVRSHRGADDEFMRIAQAASDKTQVIKVVLDYDEISKSDSAERDRLLRFLAGATPQAAAASVRAGTTTTVSTKTVSVSESTTSIDPFTGQPLSSSAVKEKVVTSETSKAAALPPPLTVQGKLYNDEGLVPSPAGAVTKGHAGVFGSGTVKAVGVSDPELVTDQAIIDLYGNMFRRVTIYEEVFIPSTGKMPLEAMLIPRGWFSLKYTNDVIGTGIYQPFFGCWSIIDALRYKDGVATTQPVAAEQPVTMPTVSAVSGIAFVQELVVKEASENGRSIERALDYLAYLYGRVKVSNGDVDEFIHQYTARKIANMEDMLGSTTLQFDIQPNGNAKAKPGTGRVGFHSAAIHPQLVNSPVALAGLVNDLTLQLTRYGGEGKPSPVPARYDVRKAKWARVNEYRLALMQGRGLQG